VTKISFVIPCYRSEHTITAVVEEIGATMAQRPELEYEIVLVSDHSPDGVFDVIKSLAAQDRRIKGIEFTRNFGQHAALMAGYRQCAGDYIVSLDDDGQTPANEAFRLIDKLEEGYDAVFASYAEKKQNAFRRFGSQVNAWMTEVMIGKPHSLQANSYYAMRRYVMTEMIRYENAYPYIGGLVFRCTKNVTNVPVTQKKRMEGKSGYSVKKLLSLWMNGFTAFSVKPLRLSVLAGAVISVGGIAYGVYTIIHKILYPTVPAGYSSLMAVLLFLGGMLMLMLGMIGEYIGRIYICLNKSPQYVIREAVNVNEEQGGIRDV
jgi:glycosyltransferase involved in cell wall biosynthesis